MKTEMRVAVAGLGFMGRIHLGCWAGCRGVSVTAACDPDRTAFNAGARKKGNIRQFAGEPDIENVRFYQSYDGMLETERPDIVSLAVPTFLHADLAVKAIESGSHVFCEKPMALSLRQCDRMIDAAEKSGKELMVGHCIRFWPEYRWLKDVLFGGEYGRVLTARFSRLSAAPAWSSGGWLANTAQSGGMALDLHIHDSDFVQYTFGMPAAVSSHAVTIGGRMDHIDTRYIYDDERLITAEGSWLASPSFNFRMGFSVLMEGASAVYDCSRGPALTVYPRQGHRFQPKLGGGDGYRREIEYFAAVVSGRAIERAITPRQSRESVRIVTAETESAASGKVVRI